ncbi:MAG: sensor hybrid histidine kinase [Chlorobi bacterium]|nr:sensor hybrid histidine kinase [Chlorobiota bacterium]
MNALRILHLEDSPLDAELIATTLADGDIPCDIRRVETADDFRGALQGGEFDLILADYALPAFDGISALGIAKEISPSTPFIFASGTLGEELAIETLKSGATDYVVKQRMERLVPSVRRALREAAERAERRQAQAELERARDIAEAANRAKDQFLAVLSHELRTPLTPVLASVYAIESQDDISDETRLLIEIIRRNVELEARLIDDLLDLSRVGNGKLQLNLQDVDVHGVIGHVLENCGADIGEKEINVALDLRAARHHVRADAARLQQVLWNLIRNAVKFTSHGGNIIVRTINPIGAGGRIRVQICDDGVGIESKSLPKIFNAFEQGEHNDSHRFGGMGLGLAISKVLVDLHGGALGAESDGRDRGSIFTLELDTIRPSAPAMMDGLAHHANGDGYHGMRILLVEDHEDTRRVIQILLQRHGYAVTVAGSLRAAFEVARHETFDLVISDIGLPDGSGLDLIRTLSADGRPVRAIALSGYGMEEDIRRSREAGFSNHLTKPVSVRKLQDAIEELLKTPAD